MKDCNQCGKCCLKYGDGGLSATESEVEFWRVFRPAIYRYVQDGEIWFDPTSGQQLNRCPWLQQLPDTGQYTCEIYHDRPEDCKHYPVTIDQMLADDCEMLEPGDLSNPKRAQTLLDRLMADSRPPAGS